jgi:hypothetical protein
MEENLLFITTLSTFFWILYHVIQKTNTILKINKIADCLLQVNTLDIASPC